MKKKHITLAAIIFSICISVISHAQNIAINTSGNPANANAILDIGNGTAAAGGDTKGLLIPRVALTARNSNAPIGASVQSILVYNSATAGASPNNVVPGYYYWDGAQWVALAGSGGLNWALLGNAGTTAGTNFLGTTDAQDLVFKTNSTEWMRILSTGNVGIGITTPGYKLDISGGVARENGYLLSDAATNNLLVNGDFEQGRADGWSGVTSIVTGGFSGNYAASIVSSQTLLNDDYIPVNPVRDVFQLEGYFKQTVAGGVLYFGYIAYDVNKAAITTAPCGTYCYFATAGYTVPVDGIWHKFSSTTSGEGTSYPNFPVGTRYVRVLGLINYSGAGTTQVDHITLKRINHGPLYVGNDFSTTNLIDQYQASKIYTTSSNNLILEPASSGNVGIGTAAPAQKLDVNGNLALMGGTVLTGAANMDVYGNIRVLRSLSTLADGMYIGYGSTGGPLRFYTNGSTGATAMYIDNSGNVGIGLVPSGTYKVEVSGTLKTTGIKETSDARWKKEITTIDSALFKVKELRGVNYKWRAEEFKDKNFETSPQIGVIAQEVEKVFPQLVGTDKDGYKSVEYTKLVAVLIEAIKEQQKIIDGQQSAIARQQSENKNLQSAINNMQLANKTLSEQYDFLMTVLLEKGIIDKPVSGQLPVKKNK